MVALWLCVCRLYGVALALVLALGMGFTGVPLQGRIERLYVLCLLLNLVGLVLGFLSFGESRNRKQKTKRIPREMEVH